MTRSIILFTLVLIFSCKPMIRVTDYVEFDIYSYKKDGNEYGAAMPKIKDSTLLHPYERRFEYLLLNTPKIHQPESYDERKKLFELYPDTAALAEEYAQILTQDKDLNSYFFQAIRPLIYEDVEPSLTYSESEVMEVASKFFYCDKVNPDTSIQFHICIGLNGVQEANWDKDYRLVEAFCYEAIFTDFDNDTSQLISKFAAELNQVNKAFKPMITSFNQHLNDVKLEMFSRMKNEIALKLVLSTYFANNQENLAFMVPDWTD